MGILNGIKQTIMRCDLLACPPTLRVKGQPAYQSILGGLSSIVIMSFFIVIFSTSFLQVLDRVDISASMSSTDKTQSEKQVTDLRIAVGIEGVQLGAGPRYFDIYMEQVSITGNTGQRPVMTNTQIMLQPCDVNNWKDVGENFEAQFNVFQMNRMLCVRDGTNLSMQGYEGSPNYQYVTLKIKTCTNNSYDSHACRSRSQIDSYISSYLTSHDFFKVKFLIVDTRISPAQVDPISKVLQKKIFMSFTDELGTKGFISFAHYSVTTDTSIMPYSLQTELEGSYIHKYATNTIGLSSDRFVYLEFFKATQELTVTRAVVKVDEMLSYVGGLFGLLWVAVAFFLGSFNQYRYELYAAQAAFSFDQTGRKVKQRDFGLLSYFGYSIYDWLNVFGCAPKCWTKMREIDQTREEICEQLDVTYLFRKIRSLQKTTACLLNQNKRICAMLTRQPTLEQTQKERQILQLYSKLKPSPCQGHFDSHPTSNQVSNSDQKSGQNFIISPDKMNDQIASDLQNLSCVTQFSIDEDQQYQQLMQIVRQAYSSLEYQNDEVGKKIREKIPAQIRKVLRQKKMSRKIVVEDLGKDKQFASCENSFIDAKFK